MKSDSEWRRSISDYNTISGALKIKFIIKIKKTIINSNNNYLKYF